MSANLVQWVRLAPGTNACLLPDGYEVLRVLQREVRPEGMGTSSAEWMLLELAEAEAQSGKPDVPAKGET